MSKYIMLNADSSQLRPRKHQTHKITGLTGFDVINLGRQKREGKSALRDISKWPKEWWKCNRKSSIRVASAHDAASHSS